MSRRITIRLNDVEVAELERIKAKYGLLEDSKAVKVCIEWVNQYVDNVTSLFFPSSYDVILQKKTKTYKVKQHIYNK